jgi:cytidylate kinase
MEKIIINIGRQIGSGGRIIAKQLAEEFNCKFYDKEILNLAAQESGFSKEFFEQNDEQKGFLKNLFHIHLPLIGGGNFYNNTFSQESLYKFQSDAIHEAAQEGNCVFVGRTADYILRDMKNVVNVFITANIDQRIQRVCKRQELTRNEARKFIKEHESERATYYNYYTGKKWGHSESYDLCINSSILGIEDTEKFIADFIRKRFSL